MTVGERIKLKRKELGLTQAELAKRAGYSSKSDISKMETAGNDIGMIRLARIAPVLSVSVKYLLGWEQDIVDSSPMLQAIERSENESVINIGNEIYKERFIEKYLNDETMNIIKRYSNADDYIKKAIRDLLKIEDNDRMGESSNSENAV